MSQLVTDDMMAETLAAAGLDPAAATPGPAALASPSYKALESRSALAGGTFVKRMHPEMIHWFDLPAAIAGARAAGDTGAGPKVLWSDEATGAIAMTACAKGWVTARQHHLQDAQTVGTIMTALRKLHAGPALPRRFDPFAEIDRVIEAHGAQGIALPDDILWLRRLVAQAEPLLDGALAPCRNDGSSSNILIGPEGEVLLVDYDRAGMNDPLYDVGCLLAEMTDIETDMEAAYTAYAGSFDAAGFARARLWSHVDDLMHALWARLMSHLSERGAVEWLKYGEWRLLRLRMMLRHPSFEEKIRITGVAA
ncbi:aminoglycoside phosphotransferase [Salipiger sp. CCB-MM3]|uniref:phosphotransferase family protein n=1 Tax=Salipiger sp. CCB-MM3 TaxID=1792508 RepID=UPI00080AB56F|nr:phosphotransferase [Salipiger sp. CCB-MM3]ANT62460.1 aminoglycoside phosphotransferase [Salipiger sp. CCB-MM3]